MRTIDFSLNAASIDQAIHEIKQYRQELPKKLEQLRRMIAERIRWSAEQGFATALVSDIIVGNASPVNDVTVRVVEDGKVSIVIADGSQAVFIEFGAGVYHNGSAGSSPHPWGPENGYLIGSYGKGKGRYDAWSYFENGQRIYTAGTPAAMPMYRGMQEAISVIDDLAKEVFA